jgi:hypothetical protein
VTGIPVDNDGNPTGPPLTDTDRGNYTNGGGVLPSTGSDSFPVVRFGAVLLLVGFGLQLLARRWTRATT